MKASLHFLIIALSAASSTVAAPTPSEVTTITSLVEATESATVTDSADLANATALAFENSTLALASNDSAAATANLTSSVSDVSNITSIVNATLAGGNDTSVALGNDTSSSLTDPKVSSSTSTGKGGVRSYRNRNYDNRNDQNRKNGNGNRNDVSALSFFITNSRRGNEVVVVAVDSRRNLNLVEIIATGGRGSRGNSRNNYDSLFSRNSVLVVDNKFLFVVNSGSNSVSMFAIDQRRSTIILVQEVHSGGEFPVSMAFSQRDSLLCVANGGRVNSIACFEVSERGMQSRDRRDLNINGLFSTPPSFNDETISDLRFSNDGRDLLIAVKGSGDNNGWIGRFGIDNSRLSETILITSFDGNTGGGRSPKSLTQLGSSQRFLSADPSGGIAIVDFSNGFSQSGSVESFAIEGEGNFGASSRSSRSGSCFLSDQRNNQIIEIDVNNKRELSRIDLGQRSNPTELVIVRIGETEILFALDGGSGAMEVIIIDGAGSNRRGQTLNILAVAVQNRAFIGADFVGLAVAVF